jgi:hypothetical protein
MCRNLWQTLLVVMCLLVPAGATVTRIGSCAAMTPSCTLTAVNAGDIKVVFAYNNASPLPVTPSGWTSIIKANSAYDAFNVGCAVASSNSDKGTGSWANAAGVVSVSYSGSRLNGGDICTLAIGAFAETGQIVPPIIYPGLTLKDQGGHSWVVGFGGDPWSGASCTPSGMVRVASAQKTRTKVGLRVSDTNGGVFKWSSTSCNVAHSTVWSTVTVEILSS